MAEEDGDPLDPRVFYRPVADDDRPFYERLSELDLGPINGSITADGKNIDEIVGGASQQIERVSNGRRFKIERVEVTPRLVDASGEIRLWHAQVDFEIERVTEPTAT